MYYLPYDKNLKEFSRYLRNNSTLAEVLLWKELRAGQMDGFKFNRQKSLGRYIVDFYSKKLNLVIEVDGEIHSLQEVRIKDKIRQETLEKMCLSFLRFDNEDVKFNKAAVLGEIQRFVSKWKSNQV